jgi:hypothetical protein
MARRSNNPQCASLFQPGKKLSNKEYIFSSRVILIGLFGEWLRLLICKRLRAIGCEGNHILEL